MSTRIKKYNWNLSLKFCLSVAWQNHILISNVSINESAVPKIKMEYNFQEHIILLPELQFNCFSATRTNYPFHTYVVNIGGIEHPVLSIVPVWSHSSRSDPDILKYLRLYTWTSLFHKEPIMYALRWLIYYRSSRYAWYHVETLSCWIVLLNTTWHKCGAVLQTELKVNKLS